MIKISFYVLYFISFVCTGQTKATVVDAATNEPISYANIWAGTYGYTADEQGNFILSAVNSTDSVHFSAVGYANAAFVASAIKDKVRLVQQTTELEPLVIVPRKQTASVIVNPINKAKKTYMGGAGGANGSLMHAAYIPYKEGYVNTPFLDKIRLKIKAYRNNTFNIRLYTVGTDGKPDNYYYDEKILVSVNPKQKFAEVDFSKLSLQIPQEGLFVVVEHIAIKSNRLSTDDQEDKYPAHLYAYGPTIMGETTESRGGWSYKEGQWLENPKKENGYPKIALEVTFTN